jgi:hypothetical protein
MPRTATRTGFFTLSWDGTFMPGQRGTSVHTAPNGTYELVLAVEKPADPAKDENAS